MSELISGKEALIALANGEEVQIKCVKGDDWYDSTLWTVREILCWQGEFRIKPRTIALNGIEVPINRKKNDKDQVVWIINTSCESWYDWVYGSDCDSDTLYWDSEEEIKQVVAALREVFK